MNVLRSVDFILARYAHDVVPLKHLGIEQKLRSHHKFNEHATVQLVAESIAAGRDAALVSDAGRLVFRTPIPARAHMRRGGDRGRDVARGHGADSGAGAERIPCDRFCLRASCPRKGRQQLQTLADEERTMIFYESPYRVVKCLEQFAEVFGPGTPGLGVAELTKKFEQTVRGTVAEVLEHFRTTEPKGSS